MSSPDAHLHTTTISARVSNARHAEITALAQAEGISLAKWLAQAITAKLARSCSATVLETAADRNDDGGAKSL